VLVLFYVRGRYRLALMPLLILFAAAALDRLLDAMRERRRKEVAVTLGILALAAIFVNRTYCDPSREGREELCLEGDLWFDDEYTKLAHWLVASEDPDDKKQALSYFDVALEHSSRPEVRGRILFNKAFFHWEEGRELLESHGASPDVKAHLLVAEQSFEESISLGYRLTASRANLAGVRETLRLAGEAGSSARPPNGEMEPRRLGQEQRSLMRAHLLSEKSAGGKIGIAAPRRDEEALAYAREIEAVFLDAGWQVESIRPDFSIKPGVFFLVGDSEPPEHVRAALKAFELARIHVSVALDYRSFSEEMRSQNPRWNGFSLSEGQAYIIAVGQRVE
jgi:hypothetical protein